MNINIKVIRFFLCIVTLLLGLNAHALGPIEKRILSAIVAGTYWTPTDVASVGGENITATLNRDGGCTAQFVSTNFDPVDQSFSPGIGNLNACEWKVIGKNNNKIEVELIFAETIRDPDNNFIAAPGNCDPGCYLYGILVGSYENGTITFNESFAGADFNLQPIDTILGSAPFIGGIVFQKLTVDEIKQRIIDQGGVIPTAP